MLPERIQYYYEVKGVMDLLICLLVSFIFRLEFSDKSYVKPVIVFILFVMLLSLLLPRFDVNVKPPELFTSFFKAISIVLLFFIYDKKKKRVSAS